MSSVQIVEACARVDRSEVITRCSPRIMVFVDPIGETVLEQFMVGRRNRPYTEWKPVVKDFLVRFAGLPETIKLRWSKNAGCTMCPCSPGFLVDFTGDYDTGIPTKLADQLKAWYSDVWVFLDVAADDYLVANRDLVAMATGDDTSTTRPTDELIDDIDQLLDEVQGSLR